MAVVLSPALKYFEQTYQHKINHLKLVSQELSNNKSSSPLLCIKPNSLEKKEMLADLEEKENQTLQRTQQEIDAAAGELFRSKLEKRIVC